jgi:vacuolar-type H+-ATPase subunit I/STV1
VGKSEKIREHLKDIHVILSQKTSFQDLSKQIKLAINNIPTEHIAHMEKKKTTGHIPKETIGELMEKYLTEIKDRINDLEKCRIIILKENDNLKRKQAELEQKIFEIEEEKQKTIIECEEKIKKIKERSDLDVRIAQRQAKNAVATFKANLWDDLQTSFFEAQDQSISTDGLPLNERIYLQRLREILSILKKHEIAN